MTFSCWHYLLLSKWIFFYWNGQFINELRYNYLTFAILEANDSHINRKGWFPGLPLRHLRINDWFRKNQKTSLTLLTLLEHCRLQFSFSFVVLQLYCGNWHWVGLWDKSNNYVRQGPSLCEFKRIPKNGTCCTTTVATQVLEVGTSRHQSITVPHNVKAH